jgi:CubicO group peptidase (beta-lactamase class C family)
VHPLGDLVRLLDRGDLTLGVGRAVDLEQRVEDVVAYLVKWARNPDSAPLAALLGEYGAQWHLNAGAPGNPELRKFPHLPVDAYWADGFEDQWIIVVPSRKLVVVRLGVSHHGFDIQKLVNDVMGCMGTTI